MSRKNEADRIAAAREAARRDVERSSREARTAARHASITKLGAEAAVLIPRVLARLESLDYPGIEQVDVVRSYRGFRRLWKRDATLKVGAYRISRYAFARSDWPLAGTEHMRLLSSGRVCVGVTSYTLPEFIERVLDHEGVLQSGSVPPKTPFTEADLKNFVSGLQSLAPLDDAKNAPDTENAPRSGEPA